MADIGKAIRRLGKKDIPEAEVAPEPNLEQIAAAEGKLETRFPPSFLKFLREAGAYRLPFWQSYWVGDDSLGLRNIVAANEAQRKGRPPLPAFLITFHNNGCGDQLCFDTRERSSDGEYRVVFWDHEVTVEENLAELFVVAEDFADWLEQEVETWSAVR